MAEFDLIQRVRRAGGDRPLRSRALAALPNDLVDVSLPIPDGHATRLFNRPGILVEFADSTGERCETLTAGDDEADTVLLMRGADGTTQAAHADDVGLLVGAHWTYEQVLEALEQIVGDELWPHVWISGEFTLTYQSASEYYSVPDGHTVDEIAYVYQQAPDRLLQAGASFLPPTLVDDTAFPRGAVVIPGTWEASTLFVSYRIRPTLTSIEGSELEQLAVLGAFAHLQMQDEARRTTPSSPGLSHTVQEGAKARIGALMWERFNEARVRKTAALTSKEQQQVQLLTLRSGG